MVSSTAAGRPSRVLVTGGAGFIGTATTRALVTAGCRVRVLDNLSTGTLAHLDLSARQDGRLDVVEGDVRDHATVDRAAEGCDAVLHLAAQVSVRHSLEQPLDSAANNLNGFLNVLDVVRTRRIPRLVHASSAAVFGATDGQPVDERSALAPLSPYGLEKVVSERYAELYATLYGVSSLAIRYFNVYGPLQDAASPYAGVVGKFAAAVAQGRELAIHGDGRQTRDYVYVDDVADANVKALASSLAGVLNVASGRSVSLLALVDAIGSTFGTQPAVRHLPAIAGEVEHSATRIELARTALGWAPATELPQGLAALAASLREGARA